MHILFLTQIVPYPPDAGPKVKTWHVLRYLAGRGHRITLVSFLRPEEEAHIGKLAELCDRVYTVPIRRSRPADAFYWLRSQWTRRPFLVERDDSGEMRALVARLIAEESVDLVHADQLTMAQFAPAAGFGWGNADRQKQPAALLDAHNAVWTILDRMVSNLPLVLRPVAALEARRVRRYEGEILRRFDGVLAVTEIDRQALLAAAGPEPPAVADRLAVIPIAVDTTEIRPLARPPDAQRIITLGTLHYPPNADGIRWFLEDVFPLVQAAVPGASLTIIGKNPPKDFLQAAEAAPGTVAVTGYVDDLDPYFRDSAVVVIPVRAGGGMRVRILEAFARALPVVTTTVGVEGISARFGEDLLVSDTARDFADDVIRLLSDPALQERIGQSGRRFVEANYDWQIVLKAMDALYERLVPPAA